MILNRLSNFWSGRHTHLSLFATLVMILLLSSCASDDAGNANTNLGGTDGDDVSDPGNNTGGDIGGGTGDVGGTGDATDGNAQIPRNNPAVITGDSTGNITEDVNLDANGMLVTTGKLDVVDIDEGESSFIAIDTSNIYGSFSLTENGDWTFSAINNLNEIQNLSGTQTEIVDITINSLDRTVHTISIMISGADDAGIISGVDSGEVTEDVDPNGNNLLEASGRLSITDIDTGEDTFVNEIALGNYGFFSILENGAWSYSASNTQFAIQQLSTGESITDTFTAKNAGGTTRDVVITIHGDDDATFISGDDTETLTEDVDPDGDNLLEASGILNITDNDSDQTTFITQNTTGLYGDFTLDVDGNWTYTADNTQVDVVNLANGETLVETLIVQSVGGAVHEVIITINSLDIHLSWSAPSVREDDTIISMAEISGYRIYFGIEPEDYFRSIEIEDSSLAERTIKELEPDTYYFVLTAYDTEGRESLYSAETMLSNE